MNHTLHEIIHCVSDYNYPPPSRWDFASFNKARFHLDFFCLPACLPLLPHTLLAQLSWCFVEFHGSSNWAHLTVWCFGGEVLLFWGPLHRHTHEHARNNARRITRHLRARAQVFVQESEAGHAGGGWGVAQLSARSLDPRKECVRVCVCTHFITLLLIYLPARPYFPSSASSSSERALRYYYCFCITLDWFSLTSSTCPTLLFARTFWKKLVFKQFFFWSFLQPCCARWALGPEPVCLLPLFPRRRLIVSHTHINFFVVILRSLPSVSLFLILLARVWEKPRRKQECVFKKKTET